jgi:hypothetical protein
MLVFPLRFFLIKGTVKPRRIMQVNSIFLDEESMSATNGNYGIVSNYQNGQPNSRFTIQYLNKFMLVEELQTRLNAIGQTLCELPADADRTANTAAWQMLKSILEEVKAL